MLNKIRIFLEMIKYQYSIHTLPFVYLGAFLARKEFPGWGTLGWITLGMISARALALTLNRYIDRHIDSRNPRTVTRALPSGALTEGECLVFGGLAALLCLWTAYQLPPLIRLLLPVIFALFIFYPFTKRFTWTCHLWLGLTMGLAPLGGWVAVTGSISLPAVLLLLAVFCLIAGSDIIYTIQDIEVDRSQGLNSIPAVFGVNTAIWLSRAMYALCFVFLAWIGVVLRLHNFYFMGVAATTSFTAWQNRLVSAADLSRANQTFAATNAFVSLIVLVFTLFSL